MSTGGATAARVERDVVVVAGLDASAYLQGQLSQDVAGLAIGASAPGFVLAPQGKVDGWGRVHRIVEDAYEIDVDPGAGVEWDARLRRFLLRTKAEISVRTAVPTWRVRGVGAPDALAADALAPVGPHEVGFDLVGPAAESHLDVASLADALGAPLRELDAPAAEAARIAAGVPAWGAELDHDTIPAAVGQWVIDASVSWTKGCYTGQELVARIDSRGGHVPRHLVGVVLEPADAPAPVPGDTCTIGDDEEPLTSVGVDGDAVVALAFVARRVEVPADGLAAAVGGRAARLVPLPLAAPPVAP